MTIPDYQSVMLPLMRFASDSQEHSLREAIDALGSEFALTNEELNELLPSGQQAVFGNRVGWARTYLKKAGLLETTRRSHFQITQRGQDVLAENPDRIDSKFLEQFEEFRQFRALRHDRSGTPEVPDQAVDSDTTPEEGLETAYGRIRDSLAADVLQQVKGASPSLFEKLVVELLVTMGYGGSRLADLMIDHNLGVSPMANYEVKRMDIDYFTE